MPQVLTHKGFKQYNGLLVTENKKNKIKIQFSNKKTIKCTPEHKFMLCDGSFMEAKDIKENSSLFNDIKIIEKSELVSDELVYDLLNVEETHSYQTNGIESHNCVFLDEFAFVPPNIAENFFTSVYPVISSGKSTKMIIVSTPNGMNLFYKMWTDSIAGRSEYKNFSIHWSMVPGRDEKFKEQTIKNTSLRQWQQEFETDFLGSTNTLISGEKLATLVYKQEATRYSDAIIYEEPIKESYNEDTGELITKDHIYTICVDVSEGKNLDYSAFSVMDISTMPYKQVAVYRSNSIPPMLFPSIIKTLAEYYNHAYVLIEINNNPQVADILLEELGYDNIFRIASGNKKAQTISIYGGKNVARGLKMSPQVKRIGCSNLKMLVENDKMVINDFESISELTTFVMNGTSYAAEEGCNDDLAMTLVLFGWIVSQKVFNDIVEHNLRKQLQFEHFNYSEEDELPIGEVDDGLSIPHFVEDGAVWVEGGIGADPYNSLLNRLLNF